MFNEDYITSEILKSSEKTAIASFPFVGKNDKIGADGAATDMLRESLNSIEMKGRVVIGEGEMDEAPMLYIGEELGTGSGAEIDIAVDPIDGTTPCAKGLDNSCVVIAVAEKGNLLNAPDIYMEKIAVGGGLPSGIIDIKKTPEQNIRAVAKAKGKDFSEITVCTLDRDRHQYIIDDAKKLGCKLKLLSDGDVAGIISTAMQGEEQSDIFIGKGGAPEGIISAAALLCVGGQMQGILCPESDEEIARMNKWGITDEKIIYNLEDMAKGNVVFCGTSITNGMFGKGIRQEGGKFTVESFILRSSVAKPEMFSNAYDK